MEPSTAIAISLISGVLGGIIGAIVNHLFIREKQKTEIDKLKAETERLRIDTPERISQLESQIREQDLSKHSRWHLKYEACLEALGMVDAVFSNLE